LPSQASQVLAAGWLLAALLAGWLLVDWSTSCVESRNLETNDTTKLRTFNGSSAKDFPRICFFLKFHRSDERARRATKPQTSKTTKTTADRRPSPPSASLSPTAQPAALPSH
jgi:hypothetical protein